MPDPTWSPSPRGVNSGYVPMGGVAMTQAVADTFRDTPYPGGLTYSGHPLAAAAAVATITAMEDEDAVGNAARLGTDIIGPALAELKENYPVIGDVRGLGCFWAVEFVDGYEGQKALAAAARAKGLVVFVAGTNRLHIVPPLNIPDEVLREGLAILEEVFSEVTAQQDAASPVKAVS